MILRRFISSILAVLVLALSCFPCSDVEAMQLGEQATETVIKAASSDNCGGSHIADICSPFCTCSCCAGFALPIHQEFVLYTFSPYLEGAFASYLPEAVNEIALPIWQPPKLV